MARRKEGRKEGTRMMVSALPGPGRESGRRRGGGRLKRALSLLGRTPQVTSMPSFLRLLTLTLLAITAHAATTGITPPTQRGVPDSFGALNINVNGTTTDAALIESTIPLIDQKAGATDDAPPNQPVPETTVTALDGEVVDIDTGGVSVSVVAANRGLPPRPAAPRRRTLQDYEQVFAGTGTGPDDRDGSIEGTAYLTYTVVSNATYDVDACLSFCSRVAGCGALLSLPVLLPLPLPPEAPPLTANAVFANLYYEFNNPLLDFVFSEKSNLKCAVYGDVHSAEEKTNRGGQQQIPPPAGLTYIQQSSGWSAKTLTDPDAPDGYELVFGPTGGANNAPGYMGFAFIDKYDVNACAALCNTRGADREGGACQYFNIWRALVDGVPTTYTCSMYYLVADESTAVNYGQGTLKVTYSRGYRRRTLLLDGGFEAYTCADGGIFCFAGSSSTWSGISPLGGSLDASIFHYAPYARMGDGVGLLGSASGLDALPGTLAVVEALGTGGADVYGGVLPCERVCGGGGGGGGVCGGAVEWGGGEDDQAGV
ncbi:hypothetical protein D9615_009658 [Tricholomella constricta]|uniref:Apple domain-containing protein n=1 Tax=Tricholomella constricta TaxID=117010 RepID=A0A8H5GUE0_9AGAR|nr:hypothetical protein D9615_009658 [Tricholomella constricta]